MDESGREYGFTLRVGNESWPGMTGAGVRAMQASFPCIISPRADAFWVISVLPDLLPLFSVRAHMICSGHLACEPY